MVSSRMRRGKKNAPSSELRVNQDTAKRSEKDTKTQTGTGRKKKKVTPEPEHHRETTAEVGEEEKPKRCRRTKAEIEADRKEQASVPIIAADDNQEDEEIVVKDATPVPFIPRESVELKYGDHPVYTVIYVDSNVFRVVTSIGDWSEYNIAAVDLKESKKPPRVLE